MKASRQQAAALRTAERRKVVSISVCVDAHERCSLPTVHTIAAVRPKEGKKLRPELRLTRNAGSGEHVTLRGAEMGLALSRITHEPIAGITVSSCA